MFKLTIGKENKYLIKLHVFFYAGLCQVSTINEKAKGQTLVEQYKLEPPASVTLSPDVIRITHAFKNYFSAVGKIKLQKSSKHIGQKYLNLLINFILRPACA